MSLSEGQSESKHTTYCHTLQSVTHCSLSRRVDQLPLAWMGGEGDKARRQRRGEGRWGRSGIEQGNESKLDGKGEGRKMGR
mgnify:CR=1 FL=1